MNIFLIRHGQTLLNESNVHQYSTTPLSPKGLEEAQSIAVRLKEANIDLIFASPMMRAQQTAEAIAKLHNLDVTTIDELREVKRPSEIEGKSHDDPAIKEIKRGMFEHFAEKDWHHSDEENFWDVRMRVARLIKRIEKESAENIVLISHGVTIKMFLSLCIFGEALRAEDFQAIYDKVHISNTGITHHQFTRDKGWTVRRVNDTAHLGQ